VFIHLFGEEGKMMNDGFLWVLFLAVSSLCFGGGLGYRVIKQKRPDSPWLRVIPTGVAVMGGGVMALITIRVAVWLLKDAKGGSGSLMHDALLWVLFLGVSCLSLAGGLWWRAIKRKRPTSPLLNVIPVVIGVMGGLVGALVSLRVIAWLYLEQ
jgi:hypothetical protein